MKKIILSILFIIVVIFVIPSSSFGADFNTSCAYGAGCSPSILSPFFPASVIWYPGKNMTKTFQIANTGVSAQPVAAQAINTSTTGNLDQVIHLRIIRSSDSSTVWSGYLNSFYSAGEIALMSSLGSGISETFSFRAAMDLSAGNEYQNKMTKFDLVIGFNGTITPTATLTPTPTQTANPTPTTVVGRTTSISMSCTNSNFDAIVQLKDNNVAQKNIKVKFTYKNSTREETTDSNGYARGGFSYSDDSEVKAEPDGFPSVSAMIRYSDCKIVSTTTTTTTTTIIESNPTPTPAGLGAVLGAFFPFFGEGEVAGATEEISETPTPKPTITTAPGEVKGETTAACGCIWWPILLIYTIILALYYYLLAKDIRMRRHMAVGLGFGVITYIVFLILNPCLIKIFYIFVVSGSIFCRYFIILDALVLVAITLIRIKFYPAEEEIFDEKNSPAPPKK